MTSREIGTFLGLSTVAFINRGYLQPLIDSGRLLKTIPTYNSNIQRFVTAEYAPPIPTVEAILELCQTPHTKTEISKHYGISNFQMRKIREPLIEGGQLIGEDAANPRNHWQRYVAAGAADSKDERIIQFCQTPRSRTELAEHLGLNHKYMLRYIKPLIEDGRLKMSKPETPSSVLQRFYSGDIAFDLPERKPRVRAYDTDAMPRFVILAEREIREFCQVPRSRAEIAERFGLLPHSARPYITKLVSAGKLKMTMPLNPECKQQRFVDSALNIDEFSEATLLAFCQTPRNKEEIYQRFGVSTKGAVSTFINPLLNNGKLLRTIPEYPRHKWQRFVAA
jgi:predicted ArsR family transcriptional regulator